MEKIVYLTFPMSAEPGPVYRDYLLAEIFPELMTLPGLRALTLQVNDLQQEIPKPTILLGDGAQLGAAVSVWLDSIDQRMPLETALAKNGEHLHGYLVTESVPQARTDRDWADGQRSPGVSHFTWFAKPPNMSEESFFHNWHAVHTPFSFDLHPTRWDYIRNAVARPITVDAPAIRGIVSENFRVLQDYTDPARLFASEEVLQHSMQEAGDFCDPNALHSVPLSEYILLS